MKAEREKRAKILTAQAERESAILIAEGEKTINYIKSRS
jgi:regulator of protease activity HflC (stomatin/prohibitin superfamily)